METYKILIIEDDEIDRINYRRLFKKLKYVKFEVVDVSTGAQALEQAKTLAPDAILMDYHLPDYTVSELIAALKFIHHVENVPIIVITGQGSEKTAMEALRLGAKDYLIKDQITPELLADTVKSCISQYKLKQAEAQKHEEIKYQAHHDFLTGLSNRIHLETELKRLVSMAARHGRKLGLMFLDLDKFKPINDTYGHAVGDKILIQVSNRLKDLVRKEDLVARIGGDEFVLIFPDIDSKGSMIEKSRNLITSLTSPYPVDGKFLDLDVSIGISCFPDDGACDFRELMHQADMAMYDAKMVQGSNFNAYGEQKESPKEVLSKAFIEACRHQEFKIEYVPCMDLVHHVTTAIEPQIRWDHPAYQHMSTAKVIHFGIETQTLDILLDWYFDAVFTKLGPNMSCIFDCTAEMLASEFCGVILTQKCQQHNIKPHQVIIRVEELLISHSDIDMIKQLKYFWDFGYQIYLRNFGVAGLPLSVLSMMPIHGLTLSPLFMQEMLDDERKLALVKSVVSICEHFELQIMAEGVYCQTQIDKLTELGCFKVQGPMFQEIVTAPSTKQMGA